MKKALSYLLVAVLCLGALAACQQTDNSSASPVSDNSSAASPAASSAPDTASSAPAAGGEEAVYRIGAASAEGQPLTEAGYLWCKLVNEKLAGQVRFEYYPAEQLGDEATQMENLQLGLQQGITNSLDTYSNYSADLNIMSMAFSFESQEHVNTYLESEYGQKALQKIADQGFHILCYNFQRLPRCIFAKFPVQSVEDLKNVKFRIADIPIWEKNFRTMGASPTVVPWSEYYYALAQGVVDAGETALEGLTTMNFYEVAPYISLVDYAYPRECFVLSQQAWDTLTPEQQSIVHECAIEAEEYYNNLLQDSWEKDQQTIIDGGGEFVEFDRQSFIDAMPALVEELENEQFWDTPGLYDIVQSLK